MTSFNHEEIPLMRQASGTFRPPPKMCCLKHTNDKGVIEEETSDLKFSEILPNFKISLKH